MADEASLLAKQDFAAFLESSRHYQARIQELVSTNKERLLVAFDDLRDFDTQRTADARDKMLPVPPSLSHTVLTRPFSCLPHWEAALAEEIEQVDASSGQTKLQQRRRVHIGITGIVGSHAVNPRTLNASHLGQLVSIDGLVSRASLLLSRIEQTVHYCPTTQVLSRRDYRDELSPLLSVDTLPTYNRFPTTDSRGNPVVLLPGLSAFVDSQRVTVQELPESMPVGLLPRSIECVCDGDLADKVAPGHRVRMVGVFLPLSTPARNGPRGDDDGVHFRTVVAVRSIEVLASVSLKVTSHPSDVKNIRAIAARKNVLQLLATGVAPSIFGLTQVKRAIVLQLAGGVERVREATRIRGDVNVLLIGEPSTAKSQMLRFVKHLVPLAISTTGRGASGVGLTAAVVRDASGERALAAGAMVLGDRGVVCIDELDKMDENDRVAMHEAMEQGAVTITKAGIHAQLNARCSVLAAANPVYGFYDTSSSVAHNVGLPDSLLTRFDLTFVILDRSDAEYNAQLADRVILNHTHADAVRPSAVAAGPSLDDAAAVAGTTFASGAGGVSARAGPGGGTSRAPAALTVEIAAPDGATCRAISVPFLRVYLAHVREHCRPVFPPFDGDAPPPVLQRVREYYCDARNAAMSGGRALVSPRLLEGLIRLATAHAKLRLSPIVEECDVEIACSIMSGSLAGDGGVHSGEADKQPPPPPPQPEAQPPPPPGSPRDPPGSDEHDVNDEHIGAVASTAATDSRATDPRVVVTAASGVVVPSVPRGGRAAEEDAARGDDAAGSAAAAAADAGASAGAGTAASAGDDRSRFNLRDEVLLAVAAAGGDEGINMAALREACGGREVDEVVSQLEAEDLVIRDVDTVFPIQ